MVEDAGKSCCRHKKERDPECVSPSVKGLGVPDTDKIDGDEGEDDERYLQSSVEQRHKVCEQIQIPCEKNNQVENLGLGRNIVRGLGMADIPQEECDGKDVGQFTNKSENIHRRFCSTIFT